MFLKCRSGRRECPGGEGKHAKFMGLVAIDKILTSDRS